MIESILLFLLFLLLVVGPRGLTPLGGASEKYLRSFIKQDELGVDPASESCRSSVWERSLSVLAEWRRRVRERRELMSLDDYALHDIGLSRADAEEEVHKPFWKP